MKDMRHENVNPFVGFFHDCGVFAIVTEFCSRGSLEDLLFNDDVKLDWMFKSSLLLDLIKVTMEGLFSTSFSTVDSIVMVCVRNTRKRVWTQT